jgi:hypothetical protein
MSTMKPTGGALCISAPHAVTHMQAQINPLHTTSPKDSP